MDDEVEFSIRPQRFDRWCAIGLGLSFAAEACDTVGNWFGTMAVATASHKMAKDNDKKFFEVMSNG